MSIDVNVQNETVGVSVSGGQGPQGNQGPSGVITVSAPLVNAGTSTAASLQLNIGDGLDVVDGELAANYTGPSFTAAVVAAAPPTTNASLLTSGTIPDARISSNIARTSSPTFTGTVSGITKSMVGLGNVQNVDATARANHTGTQTLATISDAGTAASRNVPATGNASSSQVVLGGDTRLTDARAPLSHEHDASEIQIIGGGYLADGDAAPFLAQLTANSYVDAVESVSGGIHAGNALTAITVPSVLDQGNNPTPLGTVVVDTLSLANATSTQVSRILAAPVTWAASVTHVAGQLVERDGVMWRRIATGSSGSTFNAADYRRQTPDNPVTSVAGRTGAVTIAAADVSGLAAISTSGSASDLSAGTVPFARLPVGTSSTTVAAGNDSRLSDARTPTAGSVTDASITSGGLSTSSLNWAAIQPWAASTAYAKGDLVSNAGIAYRRSVAGTSGATFNIANWQQITPSEFVGSQITSGTVAAARLGSGTPSASNYLRGDGAWAAVTASAAAVYEFTRSSKPADATGSNGSYSLPMPAGAKLIEILAIGSGGGGGSGRRGAAGTARWGGGGGAGANVALVTIPASLITTGFDVSVAAGGGGGAAVTADDTNGNGGTNGAMSSVTFNGVSFVRGIGGPGGSGGTSAAGGGGAVNNTDMRTFSGVNGGASSATGNGSGTFPGTGNAGIGGAGGGGISTGNVAYSGGTVWNPASLAGVVAAGGTTVAGGAGSTTAAGGTGANGATYGYGGSGGGASANGNNSGAGGNGGDGYVRITVWS